MNNLMPDSKYGEKRHAITTAIHACTQRAKEIARQQRRLLTSAAKSAQRHVKADIKSLTGEQP